MGRAHRVASRRDVVPTLTTLVRDAASGRSPSTVVLTAGSGSGKSRVVQEVVAQSPVPARVVAGGHGSMHEAYGVASRGARETGVNIIDAAGVVTFGLLTVVGLVATPHVQQLIVDHGRGGAALVLAR
jgi:hypothetical protein